jgi:hypothetical protein
MEERLRPLSEQECYERLYGVRTQLVTVLRSEGTAPPWPVVSADRITEAFLERLDLRDEIDDVEEAA